MYPCKVEGASLKRAGFTIKASWWAITADLRVRVECLSQVSNPLPALWGCGKRGRETVCERVYRSSMVDSGGYSPGGNHGIAMRVICRKCVQDMGSTPQRKFAAPNGSSTPHLKPTAPQRFLQASVEIYYPQRSVENVLPTTVPPRLT